MMEVIVKAVRTVTQVQSAIFSTPPYLNKSNY